MKMNTEYLHIDPKEVPNFRSAIENASRILLISCDSVHVEDSGKIIIEPTRAIFLLTIGQEYQKLQK